MRLLAPPVLARLALSLLAFAVGNVDAVAAQLTPSAPRGPTADSADIAAASHAFSQAYVAGDTATLAALYTEDAVLLPPEREVRGRAAIARYFAPTERRRNLAHAMTSAELRVRGRTAIDVGTWSNTWSIDEGPAQEASGRYLVVWYRADDGRWRIAYDMWHRPRPAGR